MPSTSGKWDKTMITSSTWIHEMKTPKNKQIEFVSSMMIKLAIVSSRFNILSYFIFIIPSITTWIYRF